MTDASTSINESIRLLASRRTEWRPGNGDPYHSMMQQINRTGQPVVYTISNIGGVNLQLSLGENGVFAVSVSENANLMVPQSHIVVAKTMSAVAHIDERTGKWATDADPRRAGVFAAALEIAKDFDQQENSNGKTVTKEYSRRFASQFFPDEMPARGGSIGFPLKAAAQLVR